MKTNIGHTEGAAGACSATKGALMLYNKKIPGSLHVKQLHADIPLDDYSIVVPQSCMDWPAPKKNMPCRMSINSFGIGGSNTHVILEEFARDALPAIDNRVVSSPLMLPLSAHNGASLLEWAQRWVDFFNQHEVALCEKPEGFKVALHTVMHGRSHMDNRICVLGDSVPGLRARLMKVITILEGGTASSIDLTSPNVFINLLI